MFLIKPFDLEAWKMNSIELARNTLKYDNKVLNEIQENVNVNLKDGLPPKGRWCGKCKVYANRMPSIEIEVYSRNMSTEGEILVMKNLERAKMPKDLIVKICQAIESFPKEKFFQMFNQSGMDHKLMGHVYHYMQGLDYGEDIAIYTQLDLARGRARKDSDWGRIIGLMDVVMDYHKKSR